VTGRRYPDDDGTGAAAVLSAAYLAEAEMISASAVATNTLKLRCKRTPALKTSSSKPGELPINWKKDSQVKQTISPCVERVRAQSHKR
jgi:hypothetical protein